MLSPRASAAWALGASALIHLGVVTALSEVEMTRPVRAVVEPPREVPFEPIAVGETRGDVERSVERAPEIEPGGLPMAGTLDRQGEEGRGGELRALDRGALLFPFVSPLTLQDTELNNLAVNQVQRIHTSPERATLEQRRATPRAADEVLLASGHHGHAERRTPARQDAVIGASSAARPSAPSEAAPGRSAHEGDSEAEPSVLRVDARLAPARGILRGRGVRESRAARVVFARPNVDPGAAATPAEAQDSQIRDDVDSELLAAKLQRSFVDTSVQRAREEGAGAGGLALRPDSVGESGLGSGARARPFSPGRGNFNALDTSDARYLRWFTQQRARVQRELVFPRARAIAKDQGTSLYSVVLGRDGGLSGAPRLIRSSGFRDFDDAAKMAIERALPFAPLPAELAPDLESVALLIPVAFANPMVE